MRTAYFMHLVRTTFLALLLAGGLSCGKSSMLRYRVTTDEVLAAQNAIVRDLQQYLLDANELPDDDPGYITVEQGRSLARYVRSVNDKLNECNALRDGYGRIGLSVCLAEAGALLFVDADRGKPGVDGGLIGRAVVLGFEPDASQHVLAAKSVTGDVL